jgi:hypothetical protein
VETSDYGIQGNRNSGSISVCFRCCRDECLRLQLDQPLESDSNSGGESGGESGSNSNRDSNSFSGNSSDNSSGSESEYCDSLRDFVGNLVLGHQLQ